MEGCGFAEVFLGGGGYVGLFMWVVDMVRRDLSMFGGSWIIILGGLVRVETEGVDSGVLAFGSNNRPCQYTLLLRLSTATLVVP